MFYSFIFGFLAFRSLKKRASPPGEKAGEIHEAPMPSAETFKLEEI